MDLSKYFSEDWYNVLKDYVDSPEFLKVGYQIAEERSIKIVYPEKDSELFLKVFREVPYHQIKVVILGQDPYHDGSFDGLAFSNDNNRLKCSPSLKNILREVEDDIYDGFDITSVTDFSLYRWAAQGVFLCNAAHTVVKGTPGSHISYWKEFTKQVVLSLNKRDNIVWLLWGNFAQGYAELITNPTHSIIRNGHPSPLNTTNQFLGCRCFSTCNKELELKGLVPIKW